MTRVFQIGVGVNSPSVKWDGKFSWGGFTLYGGENLRRSDFDHSNLIQGQKQHSVNMQYWFKSKLTCVYKEYEVKIKMVKVQWLQLKVKLLVGYNMKIVIYYGVWPQVDGSKKNFFGGGGGELSKFLAGRKVYHYVWRLINFKWTRKSHPHHNMTSVFVLFCSFGAGWAY